MKRIIIHWTAGTYYPSEYEKEHYHFLVDKDGKVHKGKFAPECNEVCRVGKYAAHTGGGNTGSIGVAICAMAGFKNKNSAGNYPITKKQFESTMELCAQLSKQYSIDILPQNVMTRQQEKLISYISLLILGFQKMRREALYVQKLNGTN